MRKQILLGVQIVSVVLLVGASALLANRWRLEGSNYKVMKNADGEIERRTAVAEAEGQATFMVNEASAKADRDKGVILAEANAMAKTIEAKADTFRVKMNNASTEAQAEAIRAISEDAARGNDKNPFRGMNESTSVPPSRGFKPSSDPNPVPNRNPFADIHGSSSEPASPSRGFKPSADPNPNSNRNPFKDPDQLFKKKY